MGAQQRLRLCQADALKQSHNENDQKIATIHIGYLGKR
jgi:hypothetical protein